MVVCDKKFLEFHKNIDQETYVLTIMNMVGSSGIIFPDNDLELLLLNDLITDITDQLCHVTKEIFINHDSI